MQFHSLFAVAQHKDHHLEQVIAPGTARASDICLGGLSPVVQDAEGNAQLGMLQEYRQLDLMHDIGYYNPKFHRDIGNAAICRLTSDMSIQ